MDYILSFTIDRSGNETNVVDEFVAWLLDRDPSVIRIDNKTWATGPAARFGREDDPDEGPVLKTEGFDRATLHQVLRSFFEYAGPEHGYAAIMAIDPNSASSMVMISNNPELSSDPSGGHRLVRAYQASAVLGSAALFSGLANQMFGHGTVEEEEAAEETGVVHQTGQVQSQWLFADVTGDIDAAEETAIMIGGERADSRLVLSDVLRVPHYTEYDGEYFTFEDETTGGLVVVQPFPTDSGLYVELRLTLPPGMAVKEQVSRVRAAAVERGMEDVIRVLEYDDIDGVVHGNPLRTDGTEGPLKVLRMTH